jgi:hypothetical protein
MAVSICGQSAKGRAQSAGKDALDLDRSPACGGGAPTCRDDLVDVADGGRKRLLTREGEQARRERRRPLGAPEAVRDRRLGAVGIAAQTPADEIEAADDDRQQCVEVVGDAAVSWPIGLIFCDWRSWLAAARLVASA